VLRFTFLRFSVVAKPHQLFPSSLRGFRWIRKTSSEFGYVSLSALFYSRNANSPVSFRAYAFFCSPCIYFLLYILILIPYIFIFTKHKLNRQNILKLIILDICVYMFIYMFIYTHMCI